MTGLELLQCAASNSHGHMIRLYPMAIPYGANNIKVLHNKELVEFS